MIEEATSRATPNRPNIVWIMADDMGWGDLGCYGSEKIPTPNMDRIAAEGIRFRDAHSSSAVCSPSRYSVLTGRYCWRTWLERWVLNGFGPPLIEPERMTVASMLNQKGYTTAAIGKWHLGFHWTTKEGSRLVPADRVQGSDKHEDGFSVDYAVPLGGGPRTLGFDYSFNITGSLDMPPFCFIENDKCVGIPDREKEHYYPQQRPGMQVPDWQDDQVDVNFAQKAVEFIDGNADDPFFLYLTPSAPHRPCVPPDFATGQSEAGKRGDTVWLFDWVVGQVLDALDRNGVTDETLIMVTSDNGGRLLGYEGIDYGHKTNGDWRGQKADIWEGGHREPFVARWPGSITPGSISDQTICLADFTATCADLMDVTLPDDAAEDSFSFLSVLLGADSPDIPVRPPVVHHSADGMFSIRDGGWKLVDGLGSGGFSDPKHEDPVPDGPTGQLYDLTRDPAEQNNVWNDHEDVVADLASKLRRYRSDGRSRPNA
jgi:arylsulfatase A